MPQLIWNKTVSEERIHITSVGYMTSTVMEFPMNRAMEYRKLAEHIHVRASKEPSSILKAEWDNLAETYTCLAEQSEAQDGVDVIYDPVFDVLGGFRR
jgi:hypothetical protein